MKNKEYIKLKINESYNDIFYDCINQAVLELGEDNVCLSIDIQNNTYVRIMPILSELYDPLYDTLNSSDYTEEYLESFTKDQVDHFIEIFKDYINYVSNPDINKDDIIRKLGVVANSITIFVIFKFPEVTVTNERDESRVIYDLYTRVFFEGNGLGGKFAMQRGTLTYKEALVGYQHSHIGGYHLREGLARNLTFQSCCLGHGTIRRYFDSLLNTSFRNRPEEHKNKLLFLFDKIKSYVAVESLSGGPYIKLSTVNNWENIIGRANSRPTLKYKESLNYTIIVDAKSITDLSIYPNNILGSREDVKNSIKQLMVEFSSFLLANSDFKFSLNNGILQLAHSPIEFAKIVSELFIAFLNEKVISKEITNNILNIVHEKIFEKYKEVSNDYVLENQLNNSNITNNRFINNIIAQNNELTSIDFKGEKVPLKLIDDIGIQQTSNDSTVTIRLLPSLLIGYLMVSINKNINKANEYLNNFNDDSRTRQV